MKIIYVIHRTEKSYHEEGQFEIRSQPLIAFEDEKDAKNAVTHLKRQHPDAGYEYHTSYCNLYAKGERKAGSNPI